MVVIGLVILIVELVDVIETTPPAPPVPLPAPPVAIIEPDVNETLVPDIVTLPPAPPEPYPADPPADPLVFILFDKLTVPDVDVKVILPPLFPDPVDDAAGPSIVID